MSVCAVVLGIVCVVGCVPLCMGIVVIVLWIRRLHVYVNVNVSWFVPL